MTNKDVQEYFDSPDGKRVKEFIERKYQDAIVYSVAIDYPTHNTVIQCYSPVWKHVEMRLRSYEQCRYGVQRGDIIELVREKNTLGEINYNIHENKTAEQIKQKGIDKILNCFDKTQRANLMVISGFQRMGLLK